MDRRAARMARRYGGPPMLLEAYRAWLRARFMARFEDPGFRARMHAALRKARAARWHRTPGQGDLPL